MNFFEKHDEALRRGRLLQAAAHLFEFYRGLSLRQNPQSGPLDAKHDAVDAAFALEKEIDIRLGRERCGLTSNEPASFTDLTDIT